VETSKNGNLEDTLKLKQMTNIYSIVDDKNGEPTVVSKELEIRGYFYDKVMEIVNNDGWEEASNHLCKNCLGWIPRTDEYEVEESAHCYCDEPETQYVDAPI